MSSDVDPGSLGHFQVLVDFAMVMLISSLVEKASHTRPTGIEDAIARRDRELAGFIGGSDDTAGVSDAVPCAAPSASADSFARRRV
jgi:hypothetical protein